MQIKITRLKNKSKKVSDFRHREWNLIHPEHFGTKQDTNLWKKKWFIFKAEEGEQLIGVVQGDFLAGVMYIDQLIVKSDKYGKGFGKALMLEVEELAEKNGIHKIYLKTGIGWNAVRFYENLGYIKEGKISNYYEHKDFWIMSKDFKH